MSRGPQHRIELAGRVSQALVHEIERRFGPLEVRILDRTTVVTTRLDQPALRALLGLFWDSGTDVHSVTTIPSDDGSAGDTSPSVAQ